MLAGCAGLAGAGLAGAGLAGCAGAHATDGAYPTGAETHGAHWPDAARADDAPPVDAPPVDAPPVDAPPVDASPVDASQPTTIAGDASGASSPERRAPDQEPLLPIDAAALAPAPAAGAPAAAPGTAPARADPAAPAPAAADAYAVAPDAWSRMNPVIELELRFGPGCRTSRVRIDGRGQVVLRTGQEMLTRRIDRLTLRLLLDDFARAEFFTLADEAERGEPRHAVLRLTVGGRRHAIRSLLVPRGLAHRLAIRVLTVAGYRPGCRAGALIAGGGETMGNLALVTVPWTNVFLDGVMLGATPMRRPVPAGALRLRFVNEAAGIDLERVVRVRPGETTRLRLTLP